MFCFNSALTQLSPIPAQFPFFFNSEPSLLFPNPALSFLSQLSSFPAQPFPNSFYPPVFSIPLPFYHFLKVNFFCIIFAFILPFPTKRPSSEKDWKSWVGKGLNLKKTELRWDEKEMKELNRAELGKKGTEEKGLGFRTEFGEGWVEGTRDWFEEGQDWVKINCAGPELGDVERELSWAPLWKNGWVGRGLS